MGAVAGQVTDHESQWVTRSDFIVSIGHGQHRRRAPDAATQVSEQIERSLIRPVQVFEN